jgi:hypothetical protein
MQQKMVNTLTTLFTYTTPIYNLVLLKFLWIRKLFILKANMNKRVMTVFPFKQFAHSKDDMLIIS